MLKPTASFRMRKDMKFMFHFENDKHRRGELKRQVIQAQLASEIKPREKKNRNEPDLEAS